MVQLAPSLTRRYRTTIGWFSKLLLLCGLVRLLLTGVFNTVLHETNRLQQQKASSSRPAAVATLLALMNGTNSDFEPQTVLCLYLAGARLAKDVIRSYDPEREVRQVVIADETLPGQSASTLQAMGVNVLQHHLGHPEQYPFPNYVRATPGRVVDWLFHRAVLLKAVLWKLDQYAYILFHDLDVFFDSPPKPNSPVVQFVAAAMGPGDGKAASTDHGSSSSGSGSSSSSKPGSTEFWFHEDALAPVNAGVFLAVPSPEVYDMLQRTADGGFSYTGGWGGAAGARELELWDGLRNGRCKNQDWFGRVQPLEVWEQQVCTTGRTRIWQFSSAQCEQGLFHYVFNHVRRSGARASSHEFGHFYHFAGPNKAWNLYNFPYYRHNSWMSPGLVQHHLRIQGWFWDRLYSRHRERMLPSGVLNDDYSMGQRDAGNTTATCRALFDSRFEEWKSLRQRHNVTWVDGWDWQLWPA